MPNLPIVPDKSGYPDIFFSYFCMKLYETDEFVLSISAKLRSGHPGSAEVLTKKSDA